MNYSCEQLNPHACKTYLLAATGRKEAAIVDPVVEHVADYVSLVRKRGLAVTAVVDTHSHADHISGGASLKDVFGCTYVMHKDAPSVCADFRVTDNTSWELLPGVSVRVQYAPGHTQDSICLVLKDRVFTGDALFLDDGGAGRDDLPGGDAGAHWKTLRALWDLPDELLVCPAHDYRKREPSTIGNQKQTNPHFRKARGTREEFVQFLDELKLGPAGWMADVLKANYACARDPRAAWIPVDSPACEVKGTMAAGANEIHVPMVPPSVLAAQLSANNPPVLLEVRETDELAGPLGHIEGVVHIPIGELSRRLAELEKYRGKAIVTVCRSGGRARSAAQILTVAGFGDVAVLAGGMTAWRAAGL